MVRNQNLFTFLLIYKAIVSAKPPKGKRGVKVEFQQDIQKIPDQNCNNNKEEQVRVWLLWVILPGSYNIFYDTGYLNILYQKVCN